MHALISLFSSDAACDSTNVRLVDGTMGREGRLEVCYNNEWGTVCGDYFWHVDARVACRHVGYGADGMHNYDCMIIIILNYYYAILLAARA